MSESKLIKVVKVIPDPVQESDITEVANVDVMGTKYAPVADHAIQILSFNSNIRKFELDTSELEAVLNSPDVCDAEIAIISIAGAFRKGKSFLLSFFIRYLNAVYENEIVDWLGNEDCELSGFSWCGGSERHTTGISVWSKIFTKTFEDGKKIGVLLMDTQGMFDNYSTMEENITIFSLSTLLSSTQIYNLSNTIQEDNLQYLQLFAEYGKLAFERVDGKSFQKLLFLIRDWNYPYEKPYGFEGGEEILKKILNVTENQAEELAYVRQHIKSCFEELKCFLMPYPGRAAAISPSFSGQLKDIDPDFKDMLKILIPSLLAPENVGTKTISGVSVKGRTLISYLQAYYNIFENGKIPKARTILNATAEACCIAAKENALKYYHDNMNKALTNGNILEYNDITEIHYLHTERAIKQFNLEAVICTQKIKNIELGKLKLALENCLGLNLSQHNAKKVNSFKASVDSLTTVVEEYKTKNNNQERDLTKLKQEVGETKRTNEDLQRRLNREQKLARAVSEAYQNYQYY